MVVVINSGVATHLIPSMRVEPFVEVLEASACLPKGQKENIHLQIINASDAMHSDTPIPDDEFEFSKWFEKWHDGEKQAAPLEHPGFLESIEEVGGCSRL